MDLNTFLPYVYAVIAIVSTFFLWSQHSRRVQRNFERSTFEDGESEASSPPSSSSPPVREDGFQYDVFLSFRGQDTRNGFTGFLHYALKEKGITTFIDSENLEKGQKVVELLECIQRSQIFVPIFSKGYADSKWCLKEIAKMVEMVECGRLIIPVFFDVEPRDVRKQTGPFANAFRKWHKNKNIDKKEVSTWRAALRKAGKVSGFNLATDTNGDQAKLVQLIVERILIEVNKTPLHVAKHPVALNSPIEKLMELSDVKGQEEVKIVGIHAMGGMGKTTLAKAVYNQISTRFDGCCFIENIRERAKQNGLASLQKQLLKDLFNDNTNVNNTDHGIEIIKKRIGIKKVLLVLDDVDHESQLIALVGGSVDRFNSGSRIIITTRSKLVLNAIRRTKKEVYELKELDDDQSLQLFSLYAFDKEEPDAEFAELSKEVVATAAGLPLALKIFGSDLYQKTYKQWEEKLETLRKKQNDRIHDELKISYDGLEEQQKTVFLDIACFFIGNGRNYATHMWEDCKLFPYTSIDALMMTSLVNIDGETEEFEMHVQIRDMGRKIIQDGNPTSRLWKDVDGTLDVLQNKEEMKNVQAIQLIWRHTDRMLWLGHGERLEGEYAHFPLMLRWLEWHPHDLHSLPDGLHLENIVVLDLSWSSITQLWSRQGPAKKLKVLNLSGCCKLTSCPDFTSMPHLQELDLSHCYQMTELHQSIGLLERLTRLNVRDCKSLKKLPESERLLELLTHSNLTGCESLRHLKKRKCIASQEIPSSTTSVK